MSGLLFSRTVTCSEITRTPYPNDKNLFKNIGHPKTDWRKSVPPSPAKIDKTVLTISPTPLQVKHNEPLVFILVKTLIL